MKTLLNHAKEIKATSICKVSGPLGAFISISKHSDIKVQHSKEDSTKTTIPIGKRSQTGKLADYSLLETSDRVTGQPMLIATVNNYKVTEVLTLVEAETTVTL